jgi:hypothetical protein
MKTERWYRRFTRHGLPRLALQTLLIYLVIALPAQVLVLSIATPDTYRQLELLYSLTMLLVTMVLIAWLVARHAAIAVQNAQLLEAEHQQRLHAEALAQLAMRLNRQIELKSVLQTTCEETAHALNTPASSLYLYDEALDALIFSGGYGLPAVFGQSATPVPRAIFDTFNTRPDRLIIIPDVQAYPDLPDAAPTRSAICGPSPGPACGARIA